MHQISQYDAGGISWKCIKFISIGRVIPSEKTLWELIADPSLIEQMQVTIDTGSSSTERQQLAEIVNQLMLDEKIYAMASLRRYGLPKASPSQKSLDSLSMFSDKLVETIDRELLLPSKFDNKIEFFCNEKGIDWERVRYHKSVIDYCLRILPHPLNCVSNVNRDGDWSVFIADKFSQMQSDGKVPLPPEVDLAVYRERKVEAERRAANLFSDYRDSRDFLSELTQAISAERPEIFQQRFEQNHSVITSNRSYRRSKKPTEKDLLLCRCEFCYQFRTMVRKRGVNPAWHCDDDDCKRLYGNWQRDLSRKSIPI
ncbi:hypothetical protein [Chamaesiphon sp. VAR_48_metabat_403]|uniref:hypothetical protein n=1 Tax=Chamaesiphon sp. VAR_48_metabat_403 TaxID=2964700 RepID=UPI00286E89B2|nr:hypothetical protein [Chamaesiphon sp. VAR_48_metabat_403]